MPSTEWCSIVVAIEVLRAAFFLLNWVGVSSGCFVSIEKRLIAGGYSVPGVSRIPKNKFGKDKIKVVAIDPVVIIGETEKADVLNDSNNSSGHTNGSTDDNTISRTASYDNNEKVCKAESQELLPLGIDSNACGANVEVATATAPTITSMPEVGYHFEFYGNEELKNNVEKMRTRLSSRYPCGVRMADMFNYLCDVYFKMEDKENSRAKKRPAMVEQILEDQETEVIQPDQNGAGQTKPARPQIVQPLSPQVAAEVQTSPCIEDVEDLTPQATEPNPAIQASSNLTRRRYIPRAVRRRVFEREGGCCSFVGDNG